MVGAERRAEASWSGSLTDGSGKVTLASSGVGEFPVTWASRTEAPGGKTSPEELIAAAHAGCFAMALSNELAQVGNPPEELRVTAVSTFDQVEGAFKVVSMALEVTGSVPGLDAPGFEKAVDRAKDGCPVSNALRGNVDISVKASLA